MIKASECIDRKHWEPTEPNKTFSGKWFVVDSNGLLIESWSTQERAERAAAILSELDAKLGLKYHVEFKCNVAL